MTFKGFEDPPTKRHYWVRTVKETTTYVEVYSDFNPDKPKLHVVADGYRESRIQVGKPEISVEQDLRPLTDMERHLFLKDLDEAED